MMWPCIQSLELENTSQFTDVHYYSSRALKLSLNIRIKALFLNVFHLSLTDVCDIAAVTSQYPF